MPGVYEVELYSGKCNNPRYAMIIARSKKEAIRKAKKLHKGYAITEVKFRGLMC